MKQLVIKTVLIALLLIIAISFVVIGLICVFSPITIANASYRLGNYDLSVKYTQKQYEKSNSFEDLALLVERGIIASDYETVALYSQTFLNHERFESYSQSQDGDYTNYIANGYILSLYNSGNVDKSITTALQYVNSEFSLPNPVTTLVYTASQKGDKATLNKILKALEELPPNQNVKNIINQIKKVV